MRGWRRCGVQGRIMAVTDAAKKLMEEALALSAEDRKRMGTALLDSGRVILWHLPCQPGGKSATG